MKRIARSTPVTDHLAVLADQVRLRLLRILEREELSVGEVAKVLQMPQSTASRHLKILADDRWVFKRTEGTAAFYRVVLDDLPSPNRALWLAVREMTKSPETGHESAEFEADARRLSAVLADRTSDALGYFGRVAGQWDDVRSGLFGGKFSPLALLHFLPRDWVVADLGCGTGNASELLAPLVQRVIAVDQSAPMLAAARKRLSGAKNVEFVRAELASLPLEDASVDACVCMLVLHHLESPESAMSEMRRVLRPGGRALIVDMVEHDRVEYRHAMGHRWLGFSSAKMLQHARGAGLMNARYQALEPDAQAKGPGLFALTAEHGGGD
jgi:ArsR family transcriptional regulator